MAIEDMTHDELIAYCLARLAFGEALLAKGRALLDKLNDPNAVWDTSGVECRF